MRLVPYDAGVAAEPSRRRRWISRVVKIVILVVVVSVAVMVARSVDWNEVIEAARQLEPWMYLVLFALVLLRQFFNGAPLAVFVPGIGYWRAMQNDTGAAVVSTVAPPPADLVLRFAMFRAWGVDLVQAASGLSLNTLLFYILRFATPVVGLITLIAANRFDDAAATVALLSGAAAIALTVGVIVVARSERGAAWIGRSAGRIAARVKPDSVQPEAWEAGMRRFREQVSEQLRTGWWKASLFLVLMLLSEALLVVLTMRFVGVPSEAVSLGVIIGAFCLTYLMTALPVGGLGVLDLALYSILVAEAGEQYSSAIIAGLIIWRFATMVVPLVLGGVILLLFRGRNRQAMEDAAAAHGQQT
jgi:uncharacterized membrane protein YbhN (UPF0104 family)